MVIDLTKYCGSKRHWNTHKLACEIAQSKHLPIEFDLHHEHWDEEVNGILCVIQDCYDALGIEQEIKFTNTNTISNLYKWMLDYEYTPCNKIGYGQFFGRPSYERLYCHHKHLTWEHHNLGIATFHFRPDSINISDGSDFAEFLYDHPEKWSMLKPFDLPYDDIGSKVDDGGSVASHGVDSTNYDSLRQAYKKICAEVVCETNALGKTHFITEKTLRPMLNGCIPLTIANAGYESYCKSLGFDIFDDVFDKSYDEYTGVVRIEKVYILLDRILKNHGEKLLVTLNTRLQNNILKVKNYIQENIV